MTQTLAVEKKEAQALPQNEAEMQIRRVCFVCTGNTCRSPMAAAVANAIAQKGALSLPESMRALYRPALVACSAGLYAASGEPIAPNAVLALQDAQIPPYPACDYRTHTAQPLTAELARECDLIVGMTGSHVLELMMRHPALAGRIVCMPKPISDPYGGDLQCYRACLAQITEGVTELLSAEVEP